MATPRARRARSNALDNLTRRSRFLKASQTLEETKKNIGLLRQPAAGEELSMNRRYFMTVLSSGLVAPQVLNADHHVISANPLEVEFDLASLQGQYTSVEDFYVRNHFSAPAGVEAATLRIEGEVENPRQFATADLAKLPERKFGALLECAGNRVGAAGLVSNGAWAGWALKDILMMARPTAKAAHLHLFGRDGYKRSV